MGSEKLKCVFGGCGSNSCCAAGSALWCACTPPRGTSWPRCRRQEKCEPSVVSLQHLSKCYSDEYQDSSHTHRGVKPAVGRREWIQTGGYVKQLLVPLDFFSLSSISSFFFKCKSFFFLSFLLLQQIPIKIKQTVPAHTITLYCSHLGAHYFSKRITSSSVFSFLKYSQLKLRSHVPKCHRSAT